MKRPVNPEPTPNKAVGQGFGPMPANTYGSLACGETQPGSEPGVRYSANDRSVPKLEQGSSPAGEDSPRASPAGVTDTIAAIATAPGEAGIAIVRVSGPGSLRIADRMFLGHGERPSSLPGGTFKHGHARSPDSERPGADGTACVLDEVILLIFRSPQSFTGEDVVEFQCHGGKTCSRRILRAALEAGARMAEPGEFSRRAFLNGRIDLLQAEAVLDLIKARTDAASSAALRQLDGELSDWLQASYDSLMSTLADVEAALDFADDDIPTLDAPAAVRELEKVERRFDSMVRSWDQGRLVRDGARVVIAGQPNSGKSTLMNCLVGLDRSIVSEHPGTTRDIIEEQIVVDGHLIVLSDTAGLRESPCTIEQDGIRRARQRIEQADLVLYVVDASLPLSDEDIASIRAIGPDRCVVVLNKSDLGIVADPKPIHGIRHVVCSARSGEDVPRLATATIETLGLKAEAESQITISERHRACLVEALGRIREAMGLLGAGNEGMLVPAASSLRQAMEQLDALTGRSCSEEVLDTIFSKFCIGK
jgi:tRNA modification GTPase